MVFNTDVMQTSFRDLLYVVFRYKIRIASFFVVVVAGVIAYTYLTEELYRSEAELYIKVGRESVAVDPSVTGPTMPIIADRENEVKSELAILTSEAIIEKVISEMGEDKILGKSTGGSIIRKTLRGIKASVVQSVQHVLIALDLASPMTATQRAVGKATSNLSLEVEKSSNIISVRYDASEPQMAKDILEKILTAYIQQHIEVHASQASVKFIQDEADKLAAVLVEKEKIFDDFLIQNDIVALESQKDAHMERIVSLEGEVDNLTAQTDASAARVASLEAALSGRSKVRELNRTEGRANAAADTLKDRVSELKMQELDLSKRYPETHRPLIEVREKLARIEASLANEDENRTEVTIGIDVGYQDLETSLENERAQHDANRAALSVLEKELAAEHEQIKALAKLEMQHTQLQRNVELADKEYREYRGNLEQARISAALDLEKVSNVSIIQKPTVPTKPIRPDKPMNIGLGILLGLFGGLFYAFMLDYLDDTLNTQEKAERRLGTRVLAVISDKDYK